MCTSAREACSSMAPRHADEICRVREAAGEPHGRRPSERPGWRGAQRRREPGVIAVVRWSGALIVALAIVWGVASSVAGEVPDLLRELQLTPLDNQAAP